MNNYERLGKTIIGGVIVFIALFFFGAGVLTITEVIQPQLTSIESLKVCLALGGIFGGVALILGWLSIPDIWK